MNNRGRQTRISLREREKILTVIISLTMIFAALAVIGVATEPSYAASGSISINPVVYSSNSVVEALVNGGSFSSSSITFYISSTQTFSSKTSIGTYSLPAGTTSLSNAMVKFTIPTETPGTYYIAASDDGGSTFTSSVAVTISSLTPSISVPTTLAAGSTASVSGLGFDPGSTISLYLNYPTGTLLAGNIKAVTGGFSASFTVPTTISQTNNPFYVVAQETSSSSLNSGITADSKAITLTASISVTPVDIAPSSSSTVTITGYGFASSSTVSSTSISLSASGTITSISYTPFTTSSTGTFSVSVSFDSAGANGPVTVSISTSPSSSPSSFPAAFYISQPNPSSLGFSFSDLSTRTTTAYIGDAVSATIYNFPASQSVNVLLGPLPLGNVVTDSNGFAQLTSTLPPSPLPSTSVTYTPVAETSAGLLATASSLTLDQSFEAMDSSGALLTSSASEYVPINATVEIKAYGLTPSTSYDAYDSAAASNGAFSSGLVTSISVGSVTSSKMYAASNGTLIFTYETSYKKTVSSSFFAITLKTGSGTSVPGYSGLTYGYHTVIPISISSPTAFTKLTPGGSSTLTVTNIIPVSSTVYPGVSYYYNAYLGSSELTLTSSGVNYVTFYSTSTSFTGSFTVPNVNGLLNISISYSGQTLSFPLESEYVVVSTPGLSASSGSLSVVSTSSGYEIVGYGYLDNPSLYYMTYAGKVSVGSQTVTGTNYGAFAVSISPGSQPEGQYSVFTVVTSSGVNYYVYSSYSVSPSLDISAPTLTNGTAGGPVGSSLSASASGLGANEYYNVYFGTALEETLQSSSTGTISTISFSIPAVIEGKYLLSLNLPGSPSSVISSQFLVTSNSHFSLSTSSNYAFPGQLVQFSVTDMGTVSLPNSLTAASGATPTYSATISLNSTNFVTVPVSYSSANGGTLNGSFQMPNSNPGSYYLLSISGNETVLATYSISSNLYFETVTAPFSKTQSAFLGLVSGNGAYILGISQSQIAQIDASINATLSVPLSQLNAAISSINGDIATITTQFGTMSASLKSINATVTSINSGVASIYTTLGQVKTSLKSLNATVVALNNDTATISTAVGVFNTTINNINATVTINNGKLATIQTDLGTFTGSVTSVSNGIATIQTALGTIQTNTNQIVPPNGTSYLLEIVILVLVVIAVVFSALAMMNTRRRY